MEELSVLRTYLRYLGIIAICGLLLLGSLFFQATVRAIRKKRTRRYNMFEEAILTRHIIICSVALIICWGLLSWLVRYAWLNL